MNGQPTAAGRWPIQVTYIGVWTVDKHNNQAVETHAVTPVVHDAAEQREHTIIKLYH